MIDITQPSARPIPDGAVLVPHDATCVFQGEIFDVYQWPQEMFDGSVETFEMIKRPDTVLLIAVDDNGEILACNEEQPGGIVRKEHLPAGRVDATDKTILDAAKRELAEETGYSFAEWGLLDVVQPEKKIEWFVYTFVARKVVAVEPTRHDAGEKIELTRTTLEALKLTSLKWMPKLAGFATLDDLYAGTQWVQQD